MNRPAIKLERKPMSAVTQHCGWLRPLPGKTCSRVRAIPANRFLRSILNTTGRFRHQAPSRRVLSLLFNPMHILFFNTVWIFIKHQGINRFAAFMFQLLFKKPGSSFRSIIYKDSVCLSCAFEVNRRWGGSARLSQPGLGHKQGSCLKINRALSGEIN